MVDIKEPPVWLDRIGKAYYKRLAPGLIQTGVLNESTSEMVATLCNHYSVYLKAIKALNKEGRTLVNAKKEVVKHPLVQVEKQAWECYARGFKELGIAGIKESPSNNALDEFLKDMK